MRTERSQGSTGESITHHRIQGLQHASSVGYCLQQDLRCPAATPRENPREGPTAPRHGTTPTHGSVHQSMQINCVEVGASALLCQECTLSVIAQLSKKSANHPNCAFADSASTVMSGVMTPCLTPSIKAEIDRQVAFDEYAEFKDADDVIQKLNEILSRPTWFSIRFQLQGKIGIRMTLEPDKRHHQYVMCVQSRIARALSTIVTRTEA